MEQRNDYESVQRREYIRKPRASFFVYIYHIYIRITV